MDNFQGANNISIAQSCKKIVNRHDNNKENRKPIISRNLIGKKKNSLIKRLHTSTTSSTKSTSSTSVEKKTRSNSFDKLLSLITTPTNSQCNMKSQINSPIHSSSNSSIVQSPKKDTFGSKSFELMMNSLLYPCANNNKSCLQVSEKKSDDMTFDEVLNKILTPDLHSPVKQKETRQNSQSSTQIRSKEKLKTKKEVQMKLTISEQQQRKTSSRETTDERQSLSTFDEDISFDQLLSQMFSRESKSQEKENTELTQESNNSVQDYEIKQNSQKTEESLKNSSQKEVHSSLALPKKASDCVVERNLNRADTQQSNLLISGTNDSFDQALMQVLTPEFHQSQKEDTNDLTKESSCREISTQTSFDESLFPVSSPVLSRYVKDNFIKTKSQNMVDGQQVVKNLNNSDSCDESLSETDTPESCQNRQPPVKHILDILSRDFTVLPDGRKVFNISQVGTDKWLQSAFAAANKRKRSNKKDKVEVVDILEEQNTCNLYIDYVTKVGIKRYLEDKTKVCEIKKTDARTMIDKTETDQFNFWNDVENGLVSSSADKKLGQGIDQICNNKEFVYSDCDLYKIDKSKICIKIHSIFAKLYDAFEKNQIPNLLVRRNDKKSCVFKNGRLQYGPLNGAPLKKNCFKNKSQTFPFCRLLYVLGKIYSLLQNKNKLTRREMFYQIKHLVKNQGLLESAIEQVTHLLGVGNWHLNIICQKGLVYGDLKLFWASGEVTNCNTPATLIPCDLEDVVEIRTNASFILVVEKESIFRKLLEEDLPNKLARPFIMLTGKGVPSINTRLFLSKISKLMALPVFILVDGDVYGIRIMLNYRFGTINSCHLVNDLTVPNARWLGVFPSEISTYGMNCQQLTKTDKKIITSMLQFPYMQEHPRIALELELLQSLNKKASIEGLIKNNTFLSETYLRVKIFNQDFI